jgi:hypothetical protein
MSMLRGPRISLLSRLRRPQAALVTDAVRAEQRQQQMQVVR